MHRARGWGRRARARRGAERARAPLAVAALLARAALSQMDVPARQSYVMSGVPPEERAAAEEYARQVEEAREQLLAAVCYATRGRGEVFWHGRKLVGLAQRRRRHGAMVQCGLLWSWRPQTLLAALGADPDDDEICGAAVGLADISEQAPSDDEVIAAVSHAFRRAAMTSVAG